MNKTINKYTPEVHERPNAAVGENQIAAPQLVVADIADLLQLSLLA